MAFTVALLQMSSNGLDQDANLQKGEEFSRRARELGADAVLFPELWNIGFAWGENNGSPESWKGWAIDTDSPFVDHFRALASELSMAIAITYLQRWEPAPRNVVSVIDRHGEIILTYAKVHTCDFSPKEAAHQPGDRFEVGTLDTASGPVQVGAMICYDRDYPESARVLMLKGAEVILTPNASTLNELNLSVFQARAYENLVAVAMTNYASPQNNGHSVAFDPIAHPQEDGPLRDTTVIRAGEAEGIYLAGFDMDAIRNYRQLETLGNAYRKPAAYGDLTAPEVVEPFLRSDARR